jgi:iron(III) transport system substrate-binding protein
MSSDREDVDHRSGSMKISRRKFLGVSTAAAVGAVVGGVIVGAVGGYLAGQSAAPAKTVTATETRTVTTTLAPGAPTTITQTVTSTLTQTRTATVTQPVTTTVTQTAKVLSVGEYMDTLYKAAEKEGALLWYTSSSAPAAEQLLGRFMKKYPSIKAEFVRAGAPEITSRFTTELDAGIFKCSVLSIPAEWMFDVVEKGKYLVEYVSLWAKQSPLFDQRFRNFASPFCGTPFGIAYNTKLLSKDEAPRSYRGLTDPKWRGRMAMAQFSHLTTAAFMLALEKMFGEAWLKDLAKQKIAQPSDSPVVVAERVAVGEWEVGLSIGIPHVLVYRANGNPIDWVRVEEKTYFPANVQIALPVNSPHPNAAKLFIEWVTSPEGQTAVSETGIGTPVLPGIGLPEGYEGLEYMEPLSYPYFGKELLEQRDRLVKLFTG